MTEFEVLAAVGEGESADWEFKGAQGGFPSDVWDTYSGMANTEGGVIVLGVVEKEGDWRVAGLPNPEQALRTFWNGVRNRQLVSVCLVSDHDVALLQVGGESVLVIEVPRATRQERPVYRGRNPLGGTYRRNHEGDYRCTDDEVKRMLAEQSGVSLDAAVLEGFEIDDLDLASIQQFRQRWSSRDPDHPFLSMDDLQFLTNMGAYRADRTNDAEGITVAGLLMFGKSQAITDPDGVPGFHLDYREYLSDSPDDRWTDRVTYDGTWECNLFQFMQRVLPKLTAQAPVQFQLQADLSRAGDSLVKEALREAFVNALIHADYRGQGGVVVERHIDRYRFSNPGALLFSVDQIYEGHVSECRNKTLQQMFWFLGYGEKAGSGFRRILRGWASQQWRQPELWETVQPDRVNLLMHTVSLLPEDAIQRLRERFGELMDDLTGLEIQALVTAELDGGVSNSRMQQVTKEHPSDLTTMLQGLLSKGFLEQRGHKRGTTYRLNEAASAGSDTQQTDGDLQHSETDLQQYTVDSQHRLIASVADLQQLPEDEERRLREICRPSRESGRLPQEKTRQIILNVCQSYYFTRSVLGHLLERHPGALRDRFLGPMVQEGSLEYLYPDEPTMPDQAYTATTSSEDEKAPGVSDPDASRQS